MSEADAWVLAFDIGGTSTKLGLVSRKGEVRAWEFFPTEPPRAAYLARLTRTLQAMAAASDVELSGVAGAVAGFLSPSGALLYNPNLQWMEGTDFRAEVGGRMALPLLLETDSNAACAGEFLFGAGRGSQRFLCLTGGTGIGVGMMVDGRMLEVAFGGLGDAGHVIVVPHGPPCSCGGHGCAEAVLSTAALAREFSAGTGENQTFRSLAAQVAAGDGPALAVTEQAGARLGVALASLTQIVFPDRIAIAGGLSALGEPLLAATRRSFLHHAGSFPAARATLHLAQMGAHATLQGAAASQWLSPTDP